MIDQAIAIDIGKTVFQVAVTAAIAWLTVKAALNRFKAERTWERRLDAYANLMTALRHNQLVLGQWLDALDSHDPNSYEYPQKFQEARRAYEHAVGIAELILPGDALASLNSLSQSLEMMKSDMFGRPYDKISQAYGLNEDVLLQMRDAGRSALK